MIGAALLDHHPLAFLPGGRWERILGACVAADRPLTRRELRDAAGSGRHPLCVERAKILRATRNMARAGLLQRVVLPDGVGAFEATRAGYRALVEQSPSRAA
ncbi:hypothetical protein [uncultured Brevundimonas sp.]|uniref:hypothetical protein n=1 Tax=uncultured Brevundimonas sp. TaxID=213418 RepID=UPI0025E0204C|nr:hypothetical protein [uncultured Brevundimonas sp.]